MEQHGTKIELVCYVLVISRLKTGLDSRSRIVMKFMFSMISVHDNVLLTSIKSSNNDCEFYRWISKIMWLITHVFKKLKFYTTVVFEWLLELRARPLVHLPKVSIIMLVKNCDLSLSTYFWSSYLLGYLRLTLRFLVAVSSQTISLFS